MLWSTILLAFREIRRNLMRSFLTVLGIVIGVSAVITMVTLGNGATQAVADQISSLGSNLLILRPGQRVGGPGGGGGGARRFDVRDAEAIRTQIGSIKAVAPTTTSAVTVIYGAKNWSTTATGTTNDDFVAANWHLASGRIFTDAELRSGKAVCVIGETVRRELYGSQAPVGTGMRVKGFSCEVIGLLASKGQSSGGQDQDDTVILPLRTVQRRITGRPTVNTILISAQDGASSTAVADQVTGLMRERRKITGAKEDDFNVLDTKEIAATLSGTTKTLTLLLGAVAAVSLLVGGIGIMNIMLVSVTERTREIGVRLAIGALEGEVLLQFLIEAIALASVGGLVGIALATIASIILTKVMSVPYAFNLGINVLSFVFSAAIGVLFGYVPARRAARLNPITALRHE